MGKTKAQSEFIKNNIIQFYNIYNMMSIYFNFSIWKVTFSFSCNVSKKNQ